MKKSIIGDGKNNTRWLGRNRKSKPEVSPSIKFYCWNFILYDPPSFCSSLKLSVDSPNGLRQKFPSFFIPSIISAFIFSFFASTRGGKRIKAKHQFMGFVNILCIRGQLRRSPTENPTLIHLFWRFYWTDLVLGSLSSPLAPHVVNPSLHIILRVVSLLSNI